MKKQINSLIRKKGLLSSVLLLVLLIIVSCSTEELETNTQDSKAKTEIGNHALRTTISSNNSVTIEAENYDNMSGIQTETTSDSGGGQNVGWIDSGDYLEYDLNVPASGSYKFEFRVASKSNNSKMDFYQGSTKLSNINKASTGGWQNWTTTSKTVNLSSGNSTLKLLATGGGWNINWIKITPVNVDANASNSTNLALNKSATQSSTSNNGVASRAVDGNTSGVWGQGSVTHTSSTYRPWWQVQLGADYNIGDIKIWNRTDCCADRLSNFDVFVYNTAGVQVYKTTITATPSPSVTISTDGVLGSRVRIKLKDTNPLSLAEVQVFAADGSGTDGSGNLDPDQAPSDNFDLSTWKITLSSGSEKSVSQLNNGYELSNQFYTASDGGMVFKNYPLGAGTTTNSTYSRVELREMLRGTNTSISTSGVNGNNWVFSSSNSSSQNNAGGVDGVMEATLKVNRVTTTSGSTSQVGRIIIGQIHASGDEPIRLYYHKQPGHSKGAIYFAHDPSVGDEVFENMIGNYVEETGSGAGDYTGAGSPSNGIALNEEFSYKIEVVANTLYVTIYNASGSSIASKTFNMSNSGFANDWMYFKAGVYSGNKSVTSSSDYEQVTFYKLEKSHN